MAVSPIHLPRTAEEARLPERKAIPPGGRLNVIDQDHHLTSLQPEMQLLLDCARTRPDRAVTERIARALRCDIDWSLLLAEASRHGVVPLLYWNLRSHQLPQDVAGSLRTAFIENAEFNLFRTRELLGILDLFEAAGISALSFKGPLLAQMAYGNVALRQFGDLDILIDKRYVRKAKDLLLARGYDLTVPLSEWQARFPSLSNRKDIVLVKNDDRIVVELHWRLSGNHFRFPLDLQHLEPRLEKSYIGGKDVCSLSPEDLLLYLCMHGSRHSWERLLWICDVAELLRAHPMMDWESVIDQASSFGSRRTLALGLVLARDLFGVELSPEVWRKVQVEPATESLASLLWESLFQPAEGDRGISYWRDIHLRMRERLSDRVRLRLHYLRRYLHLAVVPNERDHAMLKLPYALPFLYYLLRPFRLMRRFGLPELKRRAKVQGMRITPKQED